MPMKRLAVLLAVILGCAWFGPAAAAKSRPMVEPAVTGSQCVECHEAESRTHVYHGDCGSCHAGAEAHAKAEKPKTVKIDATETKQCLSCHVKDSRRMNFKFSEHDRAGVQCSDCHGIHSPKIKKLNVAMEKGGKEVALCATCHQDVMARLNMPSHHPVREGGLSCNSCHDPHTGERVMLASKTDQCTTCHQRVRGPHVFEHEPVAEDCSNCHDPHGSPNRNLLTVAQPMLCLQCHSVAGNRHGQPVGLANAAPSNTSRISGAQLRNCASCHYQVHGSSQDEHLRY
jgi:DmsE family decaheme c-type cytochrome